MSRFANSDHSARSKARAKAARSIKVRATAPTSIGARPVKTLTRNAGVGFKGDNAHVELFNAAVNGFLSDGFYEKGDTRIQRLRELVPLCDPAWLAKFIPWLRNEAHMRSAPVVLAAEYVHTFSGDGRSIVASALQRADEPGEILAYWMDTYGRPVPSALKRGISDACQRLYTERNLMRYDGGDKAWNFGDVIEMTHPKPRPGEFQSPLYKYALDKRRHPHETVPEELTHVREVKRLDAIAPANRRKNLYKAAEVYSWERMGGWLPGGMDAEAWEAMIPNLGYFALLRNLNNFDRAKISKTVADTVKARLTNVDEIRRSKVLPFRFLTAYFSMETDRYREALSEAADISMDNLPSFPGKTLIMVDCSGSMNEKVGGGRSTNPLTRSQLAGFIAEMLGRRCSDARIVTYDTSVIGAHKPLSHVPALKAASHDRYQPRGGTYTWRCLEMAYANEARVFVLTDEQSSDQPRGNFTIPVITWNLTGLPVHHAAHGFDNLYFVAGTNDSVLQTLPATISRGSSGKWPWEVEVDV